MKYAGSSFRASAAAKARGFSLIEIMVAMVIGLVLIGGAMQVYINSRATYTVNETIARMQETARYAMSVLEPDIRMAGYYGLAEDGYYIGPERYIQVAPVTTLSTNCGINFGFDLSMPIQGANNLYQFGVNPTNCGAFNGNPRPSSDTLTVRHASMTDATVAGVLPRICTSREKPQLQTLSTNPIACVAPDRYNDLVVRGYYVANDSNVNSGGLRVPSLRVKSIVAGLTFDDNEVIEGIEDFQVQFGMAPFTPVTPDAVVNPQIKENWQNCGLARFYVNPSNALPVPTNPPRQTVSVRIWLLVRSDTAEKGFIDGRTYAYADRLVATGVVGDLSVAGAAGRAYRPSLNAQQQGFRRLLVSRTFQVRNAEASERLAMDPRWGNPCP